MIKLPNNLSYKKIESIFSHAANAAHLPFEDAPETFYVIRVHVATNILSSIVVDVLMVERQLFDASIHFEAVGVEPPFFAHLALDDPEQDLDIEFLFLELHIHPAGLTRKQTNNGQFICAMASFGLDPADVQLLVLSLPSDVRLVHLDDPVKRLRSVGCHDDAQMMGDESRGLLADTRVFSDPSRRPLTKKNRCNDFPLFVCNPEFWNRIQVTARFSSTALTFTFVSSELPKPAVATK